MHHGIEADGFRGERWLEVQDSVLDEAVSPVVPIHLELPVSSASHGDLMLPLSEVKSVEIVLPNQFIGKCLAPK